MVRLKKDDDILELLREEGAEVARKSQRGLIIQPGAIGDCILSLPLAAFMKEALGLGCVDMLGHTEYIGYLPGRSCIDGVTSIDSVEMHRLFSKTEDFELVDRDPLISTFAGYAWIATFLGDPGSSFEQNLVYTAHCSGSAVVMTLPLRAPENFEGHVADFYVQTCAAESGLPLEARPVALQRPLITATRADRRKGAELLAELALDSRSEPIVMHPGSGGRRKCWCLDNFIAAAEHFKSKGAEVVFLLGPAEIERLSEAEALKIRETGKCIYDLSLTDVLGLLSRAGTFIGNDSGITHLSAGLGVRTFAVFGPTDASIYRPIGPAVTVLENSARGFSTRASARSQRRLIEAVLS